MYIRRCNTDNNIQWPQCYDTELIAAISSFSRFLPLSPHFPVIQHLPHTPHLLHFQSWHAQRWCTAPASLPMVTGYAHNGNLWGGGGDVCTTEDINIALVHVNKHSAGKQRCGLAATGPQEVYTMLQRMSYTLLSITECYTVKCRPRGVMTRVCVYL